MAVFWSLAAILLALVVSTLAHLHPEDASRCFQRPETGPCRAIIKRWFFNLSSTACEEFVWGGCAGSVPFETIELCQQQCLAEGLDVPSADLPKPEGHVPLSCSENPPCDAGEKCVDAKYPINCLMAPCPQYTCEPIDDPPNLEEIVPLSCSDNPCASGQNCIEPQSPISCFMPPVSRSVVTRLLRQLNVVYFCSAHNTLVCRRQSDAPNSERAVHIYTIISASFCATYV
ncbi:hypothetical protein DFS34DRAFT_229543 [Phlyctochytrium arcticum]|nr:hypothetical protein DFS34DRAFT_229543 [Phlyctochytrium arcticum]